MNDEHKTKEQLIAELTSLRSRIRELEESEKKGKHTIDGLLSFEKVIDTIPVGITISDLKRQILYTNHSDAQMHCYTVNELIGQDVRVFAPPDLWKPVSFKENIPFKSWQRESINRKKDNTLFPVKLYSDVLLDDKGQPVGIVTTCEDISEKKKIEDTLKSIKSEWEMTFDSTSEFIIIVDRELRIRRCNKSFSEFTQKPFKELIGRKCTEFFSSDPAHIDRGEFFPNTEIRTGKGRWISLSFNPVIDHEGRFSHSVLIGTDITVAKNIQQKLTDTERELDEKNREVETLQDAILKKEQKIEKLKKEIDDLKNQLSKRA
jgi:PAS domain S-box-containing protein